MADDILARLKHWADSAITVDSANTACGDAAVEIERLRALLAVTEAQVESLVKADLHRRYEVSDE